MRELGRRRSPASTPTCVAECAATMRSSHRCGPSVRPSGSHFPRNASGCCVHPAVAPGCWACLMVQRPNRPRPRPMRPGFRREQAPAGLGRAWCSVPFGPVPLCHSLACHGHGCRFRALLVAGSGGSRVAPHPIRGPPDCRCPASAGRRSRDRFALGSAVGRMAAARHECRPGEPGPRLSGRSAARRQVQRPSPI